MNKFLKFLDLKQIFHYIFLINNDLFQYLYKNNFTSFVYLLL